MEKNENEYGYSYGSYDTQYRQVDFRKSNRRIIISFILLVLFVVTSSVLFVRIQSTYYKSKQTSDYQKKSAVIANDLKYNLDAINSKFTTDRLKIVFSPDDILIFSYKLWNYGLYVNNTLIKNTDPITINANDKIYIKETQKKTSLPDSFINIGRLTRGDENDSILNHFSVNVKGYSIKESNQSLENTYTIEKTNFKKGKTYLIVLSDQLAKRLNFERDIIEITVK